MIHMEHLSVAYGKKSVIDDLSLTFRDGELAALIGPNGSGKSSLLKAVARILPYKGVITMDGENIENMSRKCYARRLAMVGQFNEMAFDMPVLDMVLMGRTPYKSLLEKDTKKDRAMAFDALDAVGMRSYAALSIRALSGGEKQRAVLARALAQDTDHLLLDEATNHLDIYYRLKLLSTVKATGLTVVAALHDVNLALAYGERIVALKGGKILFDTTPGEVTPAMIEALYATPCTIRSTEDGPFVLFKTL
ncbi:MAG: ABC transporter ATP-binding protein [Peptoniphilus sp.]|nr:ABC transporter ATP-binding protein [Peptoniphilus sp.]MDY3118931.1 ABC transporter ATP-binding protein [Peptoniphilus sp.]